MVLKSRSYGDRIKVAQRNELDPQWESAVNTVYRAGMMTEEVSTPIGVTRTTILDQINISTELPEPMNESTSVCVS